MSLNIIQSLETTDYISFKMECACFFHDLRITIQQDENMISMSFDDDVYLDEDCRYGFFKRMWIRIRTAFAYLFTGHARVEHSFTFKGNDQFNDYIEYLQKCKEKFKV